jgi:hypothetical protein
VHLNRKSISIPVAPSKILIFCFILFSIQIPCCRLELGLLNVGVVFSILIFKFADS